MRTDKTEIAQRYIKLENGAHAASAVRAARKTSLFEVPYIKKVEKKKMFGYDKPELWNTVIKTYPNVSQFWTYGKEKFLAQPVYSREFPPCKNCE